MKAGVYKITNNANGKIYIGSSINAVRRINRHKYLLSRNLHVNSHLQRSWNKHGEQLFSFSVVLICSEGDALWYEQRAIDVLKPEFNILPNARSALGVKRSMKTKGLLSAASLASWQTPEHRERKLKIYLSPEYKQRRSLIDASAETKAARASATRLAMRRPDVKERHRLALVAANASLSAREASSARQKIAQARPDVVARKSAAMKAAMSAPEVKKRISEASKKVWADPVYRQTHSAKLRAAVRTDAARKNNSSAIKAKWADPAYREKNCKFSDEAIRQMLRLRKSGETLAGIALQFKTDKGTVGKICLGTVYQWVDRSGI